LKLEQEGFQNYFLIFVSILGWNSFAFSSTTSIQNSSTNFLIWTSGLDVNFTRAYYSNQHPAILREFENTVNINRELNMEYDAYLGGFFILTIPKKLIPENEFKYIIFAYREKNPPTLNSSGFIEFSPHQTIHVSKIGDGYEKCDTQKVYDALTLENVVVQFFYGGLTVVTLLFIGCMFLRNVQPLKSRGIIPFALLFNYYIFIFGSFTRFYATREFRMRYNCLFEDYLKVCASINVVTLMFFDYTRVVSILSLNRNKNYIRHSTSPLIKFIKILKYINSDFFVISLQILSYLIVAVLFVLGFVISSFQCSIVSNITIGAFGAYTAFILLAILVVLLLDLIFSMNLIIHCKWKDLFFKNDPFYFRIQQIIGIVGIFLVFLLGIVSITIPSLSIFLNGRKTHIYLVVIVGMVVLSLMLYLLLIYSVLLIMMLSFFKSLYGCISKRFSSKKQTESFEESRLKMFLTNPDLSIIFKKFSDSEWSSENYLIYYDIQSYKELPENEREDFVNKMIRMYLNGYSSELEVNISQKETENLKKLVEQGQFYDSLFDAIEKEVETNLKDILGRFIFSKEFKSHGFRSDFIKLQINDEN
jgi:hypothetical protein